MAVSVRGLLTNTIKQINYIFFGFKQLVGSIKFPQDFLSNSVKNSGQFAIIAVTLLQ